MPLFLFALTQAISASPPDRIDLTIPQPCTSRKAESDEVVVCANPDGISPYRINQPPSGPSAQVPKAVVQLANGLSAAAETENADVGGFNSNRAMLRLKFKI